MKVYFDNVNFSSSSGPNSFAKRLALELSNNPEVELVGKNDSYDVFLCFIEPSHKPRPGSLFVQRLDGIWFKPEQFETHNQLIKWTYENSDAVVWQSEFDKNMTQFWWGEKFGKVIHNGIKIEKASPSKEMLEWRSQYDKLFVCSASWHRQKRLKENVEFFQNHSSKNDALVVLGNNPDYKVKDSNIIYAGQMSHEECLRLYSLADWMIHLAWLDHCPNVVVEALSQNCPVICSSSGGTKEIVKESGVIVPEEKEYKYELADYDNPPPISTSDVLLRDINVYNLHLGIAKVAENYLSLFKKLGAK